MEGKMRKKNNFKEYFFLLNDWQSKIFQNLNQYDHGDDDNHKEVPLIISPFIQN